VVDRLIQQALHQILRPLFEGEFPTHSYGFRPGRSAAQAVRQTRDVDLEQFFDSLPHAELIQCVARRISDRHVLALIKQWLVAPVEEDGGRGRRKRITRAKDIKRGIPQGGADLAAAQ
jgi:retron-type reverse transcriptase